MTTRAAGALGSRASVKSSDTAAAALGEQHRRREQLLKRQKEARRNLTDHARRLGASASASDDENPVHTKVQHGAHGDAPEAHSSNMHTGSGSSSSSRSSKRAREEKLVKRREYWSSQFSCPEWMTEVPSDLNGTGRGEGAGERLLAAVCTKCCPSVAKKHLLLHTRVHCPTVVNT